MNHWHVDMTNAHHFIVQLNGKNEGSACVEANSEEGWVRREWMVGGTTKRRRKFYGRVFIVRVKEFI